MRCGFRPTVCAFLTLGLPALAFGNDPAEPKAPGSETSATQPAAVDFDGFLRLSREAGEHRRNRTVPLDRFLALAGEKGTVVLDTRSKEAFDRLHLRGAVHLNFADFTADKLAATLPDKTTRVLIYCNNNFRNAPKAFPTKKLALALNIPTFVNLYGYGYRDLYELGELLPIDDPRLEFEGAEASAPLPRS